MLSSGKLRLSQSPGDGGPETSFPHLGLIHPFETFSNSVRARIKGKIIADEYKLPRSGEELARLGLAEMNNAERKAEQNPDLIYLGEGRYGGGIYEDLAPPDPSKPYVVLTQGGGTFYHTTLLEAHREYPFCDAAKQSGKDDTSRAGLHVVS